MINNYLFTNPQDDQGYGLPETLYEVTPRGNLKS